VNSQVRACRTDWYLQGYGRVLLVAKGATGKGYMSKKYYSTDLTISIVSIKARNKEHAEYRMQRFIDKIALVMTDKISWDEAEWTIEENILDKAKGEWVKQ
jgi:hypothetical protein